MKPVSLSFCGINSFSEPATIDFEKLLEFGIFGIFGDTGSGKSTILDCIGFALYGNVARSRSGSIAEILHYSLDKGYVHFVFEIVFEGARRTFRVERELKRKNAAQTLKVYEKKGDSLLVLADGVREGNALLERIIGLEQRDFEKCIALPQGEFAQFVRSARADRLKLVSRLFDLEAYGEGLVKRAGAKMAEAREELRVTEAKLAQFEGYTKESHAALKDKERASVAEDAALRAELTTLRAEEKALTSRVQLRREYDEKQAKFARLEAQKEGMRALNEELERLDRASAALRDADEAERDEKSAASCAAALTSAKEARERAQKAHDEALLWDMPRAEEEEHRLSDRYARAKSDEVRRTQLIKAQKKHEELQARFSAERDAFKDFDYERERARLEQEEAALGSGDFLAFAEKNGKAELLHAEYAVFADELTVLTRKHPAIEADSRPLIQKYTALSAGGTTDLARLRKEYEEQDRDREKLRKERLALEAAKGAYERHLAALQSLSEQLAETKELIRSLGEGEEGLPPASELFDRLTALRRELQRRKNAREEAQKALSEACAAYAATEAREKAASERAASSRERLVRTLSEGKFSSVQEAKALCERYGDPRVARERVEAYREEYGALRARLKELQKEDISDATQEALSALQAKISGKQARAEACSAESALLRSELARSEEGLRRKAELEKEHSALGQTFARYERLRKLLEGNKFMEYVAEEYLQTVAENASGRLLSLTDGRYFLRYEGGFFVGDNFNGGALRGVYTLSGGETFLVSLSLALALSAEICARSLRPIEFFFLDEGFGTLDEHLIDVVMDSLERLRGEHFSIGIISHVEELKHRIERKLLVKKATERHGSQIEME